MSAIDFLKPDTAQIRHQIRGILESYSNEWDLIAELAQNSIDAVTIGSSSKGHLYLTINAINNTVVFKDNGIGIAREHLATLLRPFGTNKYGRANQIGEKGVGVTFVIFSTEEFVVETCHQGVGVRATIRGASNWLTAEVEQPLLLEEEVSDQTIDGTAITLKLPADHPIFDKKFEEVRLALLTKTAAGNTSHIWDSSFNSDITITVVDKSGTSKTEEHDCNYALPIKYISKSDYISLTEYKDWLNERDRSDAEKRRKLHNKVVYNSAKKWQAGREIKSWSCFVPNRQAWNIISKSAGIDMPEEPSGEGIDELSAQLAGGLYTSTKGMPTGISLELKPRGSAGYAPNFFIIIEDPSLRFDIGRKAIQSRQQGMLKEIAYESFRDYINFVRKYLAGSFDDKVEGWDRQTAFDEISILPDLASSKTTFVKRPNTQEATVCAIFYELLGKGHVNEITPLISGYNNRYDLYAKVRGKNSVIEFKYDLSGVFKDFNDERKMFDEIDCIVCWEITERDRREATRRGLNIEEIGKSSFSSASKFPHATAELWIDSVKPIYIIEVRGLTA